MLTNKRDTARRRKLFCTGHGIALFGEPKGCANFSAGSLNVAAGTGFDED